MAGVEGHGRLPVRRMDPNRTVLRRLLSPSCVRVCCLLTMHGRARGTDGATGCAMASRCVAMKVRTLLVKRFRFCRCHGNVLVRLWRYRCTRTSPVGGVAGNSLLVLGRLGLAEGLDIKPDDCVRCRAAESQERCATPEREPLFVGHACGHMRIYAA